MSLDSIPIDTNYIEGYVRINSRNSGPFFDGKMFWDEDSIRSQLQMLGIDQITSLSLMYMKGCEHALREFIDLLQKRIAPTGLVDFNLGVEDV